MKGNLAQNLRHADERGEETMKTLQELYNEVMENKDLQAELVEAAKPERRKNF